MQGNLYGYVSNSPLAFVDPSGLQGTPARRGRVRHPGIVRHDPGIGYRVRTLTAQIRRYDPRYSVLRPVRPLNASDIAQLEATLGHYQMLTQRALESGQRHMPQWSDSPSQQLLLGPALTARQRRASPGVATGRGTRTDGSWLRGSHGNAGWVPEAVAQQLAGRRFNNFDHFRSEFWKAVSRSEHAKAFSEGNQVAMREGRAPHVVGGQAGSGHPVYELHHVRPINQNGGVYDLSNILVVTPRFHQDVLDPAYHRGGQAARNQSTVVLPQPAPQQPVLRNAQ